MNKLSALRIKKKIWVPILKKITEIRSFDHECIR